MLNYYKNQDTFSGSVDEDCIRHLVKFNNPYYEYNTGPEIWLTNFALQHTSRGYHYFQSMTGKEVTTCPALFTDFQNRYTEATKTNKILQKTERVSK